jgi:hypothetical protein
MSKVVRQLASQGYSDAAIAEVMHMSLERVRSMLLGEKPAANQPTSIESISFVATPPAANPRRRTAEDIGRSTLERLANQRAEQQAKAQALRDEIARLADADRGPRRGLAKRIRGQLRLPLSLRAVQWHVQEIVRARE